MCHSVPFAIWSLKRHWATRKSSILQLTTQTFKTRKGVIFSRDNFLLTSAGKARVWSRFVRVRNPLFADKLWYGVSLSGLKERLVIVTLSFYKLHSFPALKISVVFLVFACAMFPKVYLTPSSRLKQTIARFLKVELAFDWACSFFHVDFTRRIVSVLFIDSSLAICRDWG